MEMEITEKPLFLSGEKNLNTEKIRVHLAWCLTVHGA
jgi:hypothetical protein